MAYLDSLYEKYYIEYASYVIKDRAIPHLDDGLKPVQRRILHALHELDDGKFHKVANVVGKTMQYHPHGDGPIYSALVVLANKDLLIEKQGNFGNIYTGDPASAARYIECRLTPLAKEVIFNSELTQFQESYDGRNKEPVIFPAKIPALLAQGAEGIAVGMATRILPHNLIELLEAEIDYLQDRPFQIFPDFPTAGLVEVSDYNDGNGKVLVRAQLDISDSKRIIIREIPFGTTTESLIASIEDAAKKDKIKVSSINDYTAENVEIELKLQRGAYVEETVDALYAFTDCENSVSANLMVIDQERPCVLTVTEIIQHNVDRLVDILKTELEVEAGHLANRLHAKTLEQIFIENRIYKTIETMTTSKTVIAAISEGLAPFAASIKQGINQDDIETLLKIPIRRISLYDINKVQKEMTDIRRRMQQIKNDLSAIIPYTVAFLENIVEKYRHQFPRRTQIISFQKTDVRTAAKKDLRLCYDKKSGYIGYAVEGKEILAVSQYDRVLIIRKDATYSIIDAPDKLFIDKDLCYCGFIDKDLIFNVVFRDKSGNTYIKRCCVEQFILDRIYELIPPDSTLLKFTTDSSQTVALAYKAKPRLRILEEKFAIENYPVRSLKAGGIRLTTKELRSYKLV